jgi:hypothetical protein
MKFLDYLAGLVYTALFDFPLGVLFTSNLLVIFDWFLVG